MDYLHNVCERNSCRAPAYGRNNKRADEWEMRDKPGISRQQMEHQNLVIEGETLIAIRDLTHRAPLRAKRRS
eukprot:9036511-Pyramimonas_sp.AAC.1